jgi:protein-L-isoaspartate(D-aspartate) O-methyltransferase
VADSLHGGLGMTSQRARERLAVRLREQGIDDERVLDRVRSVPRHLFVDEALASRAYEDTALPIGHGQTISQPYVVARMTALALRGRRDLGRVLEVGTGSGYQTAVLAPLALEVDSVERIRALYDRARRLLATFRFPHLRLHYADGLETLGRGTAYDTVVVTAAVASVPEAFRDVLETGGRIVAPVGGDERQRLVVVERDPQGRWVERRHDEVYFVRSLRGVES